MDGVKSADANLKASRRENDSDPRRIDLSDMDPALALERPPERLIKHTLGPATVAVVWALAFPTIIEQVLQAVVGLTDTIVAGHIPGDASSRAAAGAAVGIMNYLQWFVGLMTSAFGVGATAIVARSIGAARPRVARRVAGTSVGGGFIVSAVLALLLFIFARQVVWVLGLHDLAALYGRQYLRIMVVTIALQTIGQLGMACMRGAGDTVRPMLITGGVTIINVLTSSSLTFGWFGLPAWGIQGNALGTMVAFFCGGIATLVVLMRGMGKLKINFRHLRPVPHVVMRVLRIGVPSWLEGMLLWSGQILIVIFIIARNDAALGLSGVTMAAHNAVLRIESIAFLPGFGFGIAAAALVGQYLGAGRADQARRAAIISLKMAFWTMTVAAVPMVLFPHRLLAWMVDSPPVVDVGVWPMVLAGLAQPGFAIAIVMGSGLKGAGETIWPMISTIVGMFLVRVPIMVFFLWLFHHLGRSGQGLIAVWLGIFVDLNFRALINGWVFFRGRWQTKIV